MFASFILISNYPITQPIPARGGLPNFLPQSCYLTDKERRFCRSPLMDGLLPPRRQAPRNERETVRVLNLHSPITPQLVRLVGWIEWHSFEQSFPYHVLPGLWRMSGPLLENGDPALKFSNVQIHVRRGNMCNAFSRTILSSTDS